MKAFYYQDREPVDVRIKRRNRDTDDGRRERMARLPAHPLELLFTPEVAWK